MRSIFRGAVVLGVVLAAAASLRADVKLPAIFGDHMVLQRDIKIPIWGWADPGEAVTVTAADHKATATAGADGKWIVRLDSLGLGEQPISVTVAGKNTVTFNDVLIGDVWVCSGQSNMEFSLNGAHNSKTEIPKADHPKIRLFLLKKKIAFEPQSNCEGQWTLCTPQTAPGFSAVAYFFGCHLQKKLNVPIGLIGTYWGGTPAQAWTSLPSLQAEPSLKSDLADSFINLKSNMADAIQKYQTTTLANWQKQHDKWVQTVQEPYKAAVKQWAKEAAIAKKAGKPEPPRPVAPDGRREPRKPSSPDNDPHASTVLFNGMIAPIVPFAIKGAIWYQGESNSGNAAQYRILFPAMITDWRKAWNQGDFPFLFVQLANFMQRSAEPNDTNWARLRESQTATLSLPNTGQAVIIDIGQSNDIHPKDKMDVGDRLALAGLHVAYGQDLVYSGPMYDSLKIEGNKARVTFKHVGGGLTIAAAPSTQPDVPQEAAASAIKGFAIAGADKNFVWADAVIDGNTIVVSSPQVAQPVAVRYGWGDNPATNLYNKDGLPACPFRTDDWPMPTPAPTGKK